MCLEEELKTVGPADEAVAELSRKKWLAVAKPLFSLGRLEELVTRIAAVSGDVDADCSKKALVIMCADNGVVDEGVTQCDRGITAMVTENFTKRSASVCIMAERAGCDLFPVDIGVETDVPGVTDRSEKIMYCTNNIAKGAAMTRGEAERAVLVGIRKVKKLKAEGYKLIATGEMGIGNTTTAAAVLSVLLGADPELVTGRGAGLSSEGLARKTEVIKTAIALNRPDKDDIIDVISKVGGLDIAGMCGVFLGGAVCRVPVIIDGVISAAAALCAVRLCPAAAGYMIPSHVSKEPASAMALEALGMEPYLNCGMFLGEGSGAVALMPLIDMAVNVYNDMPTFGSWDREGYKILE